MSATGSKLDTKTNLFMERHITFLFPFAFVCEWESNCG